MNNRTYMKYLLVMLALSVLEPIALRGQEWIVPEDRKGKLSTFPFTDETRKDGEQVYRVNCLSCHGTPTKGNYINLVPPPGDPATDKIQHNSDGEIYYKVTSGRGQMPSFRSVLTGDQIWHVISYIRSFNRNYVQKVMQQITSSAYPGAVIMMKLGFSSADTMVIVTARAVSEKGSVPVTGAGVRLFAKRYFGMLPVDEEKTTDAEGAARFRIPASLPGDTAGNIQLSARFTDEEVFGSAAVDTLIRAGQVTVPVSLVSERAMWNVARKAPWWVLLSYITGVFAVWGFILGVMMKLRDIYTVGTALQDQRKTE